jgi:hypothetical protein
MARLPDMIADDEAAARIRARRSGELCPLAISSPAACA